MGQHIHFTIAMDMPEENGSHKGTCKVDRRGLQREVNLELLEHTMHAGQQQGTRTVVKWSRSLWKEV